MKISVIFFTLLAEAKLVWDARVKKWKLCNLEADRTKMRDLANANPAKVAKPRAKWEHWANLPDVRYKSAVRQKKPA